jgi:hypothetical protein
MAAFASPDPTVAITVATFVLAAFSIVAWLCRPRSAAAAAPRPASDLREHLVELTAAGSAAEADQLATWLRRRGVVALANAGPVASAPGMFGAWVVVLASDLERARSLLAAEQRPEGDVPVEEIEAELADPQRLEQLEREIDGTPRRWWGHRLVRGDSGTLWAVRIGLCAVVVGWLAVLASAFV